MDLLYKDTFCALDLETTGVNPYRDRIIEVGIVRFNLADPGCEKYHALVNPEQPISESAFQIHGISSDELRDKPCYTDIADDVLNFIGSSYLVIQNPSFDLSFLHVEHRKSGHRIISNYCYDTVLLSRYTYPQLKNHKLETVSRHLNLKRNFHRALDDALCCSDIFRSSIKKLDPEKSFSLNRMNDLCGFNTPKKIFRRVNSNFFRGLVIKPGESYIIKYIDKEGTPTERTIIPKNIYKTGAQTVIHAFCLLRNEDRYFNTKRIKHIAQVM